MTAPRLSTPATVPPARGRVRARNLVVLVSDMKGFTARTSRQTREQNARMMALHDALILPVLRGFRGRKVKGIGDALIATFESPTDAVLSAMAIQDRLGAFNAAADENDRIEVRITLSQGELRFENDDVRGEPVQLALEAQREADAGDVVLTDAVYLSMNKLEAVTEVIGHRLLRGGGTVRLRRALRGADPARPYGGRALERLGRLPNPSLPLQLHDLVHGGGVLLRRRAPFVAILVGMLALGAGERSTVGLPAPKDPVERAAALIEAKQPLAALAELDKVADSPRAREARVAVVRAKALQEMGELGPAFSDFAAAADQDIAALDESALRMLADSLDADAFPTLWRPALKRLLGEKLGRRIGPAVRPLLASPHARSRADALETMELAGAATDEDRLKVATADLNDSAAKCAERRAAVRRLVVVGGPRAQGALQLAAHDACAGRDAQDALRLLARRR